MTSDPDKTHVNLNYQEPVREIPKVQCTNPNVHEQHPWRREPLGLLGWCNGIAVPQHCGMTKPHPAHKWNTPTEHFVEPLVRIELWCEGFPAVNVIPGYEPPTEHLPEDTFVLRNWMESAEGRGVLDKVMEEDAKNENDLSDLRPRTLARPGKHVADVFGTNCGRNDVHGGHWLEVRGYCEGVKPDGTGLLFMYDSQTDLTFVEPWPSHPEKFNPGVLDGYAKRPAPPEDADDETSPFLPQDWVRVESDSGESWYRDPDGRPHRQLPVEAAQDVTALNVPKGQAEPIFGVHDDQGRSLVEFIIRDGKLDAKYYDSDLYPAAQRFVKFILVLGIEEDQS